MGFTAFQLAWNDGTDELRGEQFPEYYHMMTFMHQGNATLPVMGAGIQSAGGWLKFEAGNSVIRCIESDVSVPFLSCPSLTFTLLLAGTTRRPWQVDGLHGVVRRKASAQWLSRSRPSAR